MKKHTLLLLWTIFFSCLIVIFLQAYQIEIFEDPKTLEMIFYPLAISWSFLTNYYFIQRS